MLRHVLTLVPAMFVAGCAVQQPMARASAGAVRTVAFANGMPAQPHNTHLGVTIFGNFVEPIQTDWRIPSFVEKEFATQLARAGISMSPVALTPTEMDMLGKFRCFSGWDGSYKPSCGAPLTAMLDRLGVDALVFARDFESDDWYLGTPNRIAGYGLFTAATDRPNVAVTYAHVAFDVIAGRPAQYLQRGGCYSLPQKDRSPWPKDIGDHTAADLAWLRPELERLFRLSIGRAINQSGIAPGATYSCPTKFAEPWR